MELSSAALSWKAPKEERTMGEDRDEQSVCPGASEGNNDVMLQVKILTDVCVCDGADVQKRDRKKMR